MTLQEFEQQLIACIKALRDLADHRGEEVDKLRSLLEKEVRLRSESELYGKIPSSYGPTPNDFKENADKTWEEYKQTHNL